MVVIDQRDQRVETQTNVVIQPVLPTLTVQERDNRRRMLARMQAEVGQRLDEALGDTAWIALALEYRPEAVPDWRADVGGEHGRRAPAPRSAASVVDAFDALDGELLILGEPGSGKTTTLLELTRELIERAQDDESFPMPVVFHLASWATRRAPLAEWLVGELASPAYGVPLKLAQGWVESDQILPLLDGLDEVAPEQRSACVAAINAFRARRTLRLARLVICCRRASYEALPPLHLRGAILVRPLTERQVDAYLADAGDEVAGLRAALQEDAALRELATTPLLLNLMVLAYQGVPAVTLLAGSGPEGRRGQLLTAYVRRMFARRGKKSAYTPERTIQCLGWLARGLAAHSHTIFYLESLQAGWLEPFAVRRWFSVMTRLVVGLSIALAPGLIGGLLIVLIIGPFRGLESAWANAQTFVTLAVLLVGLPYAVAYGVVSSLMSLGSTRIAASGWGGRLFDAWRQSTFYRMSLGLLGGLTGGLIGGMVGGVAADLALASGTSTYGLAGTLMLGLFLGLIFGPIYGLAAGLLDVGADRLAHFRVIRWSPRAAVQSAGRGVVAGLVTAWFMRLAISALTALVSGEPGLRVGFDSLELTYGVLGGVFGGLLGGITYGPIQTRSAPNQGIRQATRRALLVGSVSALFFGLLIGPNAAQFGWERAGLLGAIMMGVFVAVGVGLAGGIASGMAHGGEAWVSHVMLRLLLWRAGLLPLRSIRFLEHATDRVLLRRVGGGYMFVHGLLQDHVAAHERKLVEQVCSTSPG